MKNQVPIRTFSEWSDVVPGFFEIDTVSHCATNPGGKFLSTLNMTDIATGWTEPLALFRKGSLEVVSALDDARDLIPFPVLGIDSDNGSEFLNYDLLEWCRVHSITFTRSRAYKKNDQAWIEEKNRSVVRKSVGDERFEGDAAWQKLRELYTHLRLYVNFYQPSQKLVLKRRDGARSYKSHDVDGTPYQRVLESPYLTEEVKQKLTTQRQGLSVVGLHRKITTLQEELQAMAVFVENPLVAAAVAQRLAVTRFIQRADMETQTVAPQGIQTVASEQTQTVAPQGIQTVASEQTQTVASQRIQTVASQRIQTIASEHTQTVAPRRIQTIASEQTQTVAPQRIQNVASEQTQTGASQRIQTIASEQAQTVASQGTNSIDSKMHRGISLPNRLLSIISTMSVEHVFQAGELASGDTTYAFSTLCKEGWIKRIGTGRYKVLRKASLGNLQISEEIVLSQASVLSKLLRSLSSLQDGDIVALGELASIGNEDSIYKAVKTLTKRGILSKVGAGRYMISQKNLVRT